MQTVVSVKNPTAWAIARLRSPHHSATGRVASGQVPSRTPLECVATGLSKGDRGESDDRPPAAPRQGDAGLAGSASWQPPDAAGATGGDTGATGGADGVELKPSPEGKEGNPVNIPTLARALE